MLRYVLTAAVVVSLACACAGWAAPGDEAKERRVDPAEVEAREQRNGEVQRKLDRAVPEVSFNGNELADVVDFLRDVTGANLFVNWRALEAAGIKKDAKVTARLKDLPFAQVLQVILNDVAGGAGKLSWAVDNGVVTISTVADLRRTTQTRTYDVRFLIDQKGKLEGAARERRVASILKMVQGSVEPSSWRDGGGSVGAIKELGGQLIVTQTTENQRAIENLVEQLQDLLKP